MLRGVKRTITRWFAAMLFIPSSSAGESPPPVAPPLPLRDVRLTGGPLKRAQDLDAEYLLSLSTDRLLAGYRVRAGLAPKAPGYGGWDAIEGKQLTGHIAGHYLSAVSLMFAATGDVRFKERADRIVEGFLEAAAKRGNGYLGAQTDSKGRDAAFVFETEIAKGDIRSGGFDLNGMWAPWYTLHKIFAGLRDAWRHTGNRDALALSTGLATWTGRVLENLSDAQIQKMLDCEFGGMNEVLVDLSVDTGDPHWMELSRKFEHAAVTGPLRNGEDILPGKHGNTQVPKLIGSLERYAATGDAEDLKAALFFWERVTAHHSFATGGHGKDEYFGEPDRHNDRVDGRTAESCNIYNMLKLTRRLFSYQPSARFADFQERALFNHVLGSIDPGDGSTCYMVPVGRGVEREYADMAESFTCCVGTGMENHALHGAGIYHASQDTLWINLYAPSTAVWKSAGVSCVMETDFPIGDAARIAVSCAMPKTFKLALRRPAGCSVTVRVNGVSCDSAGGFFEIDRTWSDGDVVELAFSKSLRLEPLPDNPDRVAILWGPLVLAGRLGSAGTSSRGGLAPDLDANPVLVAAGRPPAEWLEPVPGKPGVFRTRGVGRDRDVELLPFHQLHRARYAAYWDLYTESGFAAKAVEIRAERERQRQLEAATVAYVQPGEMQPERDFNQQGADSTPDRVMGRACRRGSGWFSYDVPVEDSQPMTLIVTYHRDEWRRRTFDLKVDGSLLGSQVIEARGVPGFFEVAHPLPPEVVRGKKKVTIRFDATQGNEIGAVFGLRMVRGPGR